MSPNRLRRRASEAAIAALVAAGVVFGLSRPGPVAAQAPAPPAAAQDAGPRSSEQAYAAQAAAWSNAAPGPKQPIPFSHALHAGQYKMACLYCHTGTDRSAWAGVPSVEVCMGCHSQFGGDLQGIQILKQYWEAKQSIPWIQVYWVPDYVKFKHARHIAKGIPCQRCHGPVETMDKLYVTSDTIWWPWLLPAKKLEMGWCINCHRENQAPQDCLTCHY